MTATVVEDTLPAFLPTAPPPPMSSAASSTTGGDIEGAMEHLTINGNNNNGGEQSPPSALVHQPHPLPQRPPQMTRPFSHPMFPPINDMPNPPVGPPNDAHGGAPVNGDQPQPPVWSAAYPLPPVFANTGPPFPPDALGLMYGPPPPGPRPMLPICLPQHAYTPVPPRPHPFLSQPVLYVSFVPADLGGDDFDQPLRRQGIHALALRLPDAVKPVNRTYPDTYYSWMTKNGCLQFQTLHDAEKALSILVSHPYFVFRNVLVSPLPPPNVCPLPPAPVAPRFIRPIKLASSEQASYPQPGQLWDFVRPWGSIREVAVTLEESHVDGQPGQGECRWRGKVQFWYEEEAHRFETSYPNSGPFAGWEIEVRRDPSYIPMAPLPFQQPMAPFAHPPMGPPFAVGPPPMEPHFSSPPTAPRQFSPPAMPEQMPPFPEGTPVFPPMAIPMYPEGPFMYPTPDVNGPRPLPMMMNPDVAVSPNGVITPLSPISPVPVLPGPSPPEPPMDNTHAMGIHYVQHHGPFAPGSGERMPPLAASNINVVPPPSPPNIPVPRYVPPWLAQNGGTMLPMSPPYASSENLPQDAPPHPQSPAERSRNDWSKGNGKNWREVHGGIVSEDGHVIQHVPYRPPMHMSPKKAQGNGRGSHSGPVDFCTLVVRNLAGDVTALFLADQFSRFGPIANARVMRDSNFRSRGFAFVTFQHPDDAANALTNMQGAELAGRRINISYQERRNFPNNSNRGFPTNRGRGGGVRHHERPGFMHRDLPPNETSETNSDRPAVTPSPQAEAATKQTRTDMRTAGSVSAPSRLQPHSAAASAPAEDVAKVSYENVTMDALAVMRPSKALAVITGGGKDLLAKLNLREHKVPPHGTHSPGAKKVMVANAVNKVILHAPSVEGRSSSHVIACIRDFVNGLNEKDEEALDELLRYPAIINAMIAHKLKGFKSPRPPAHQSLPV